MSDPRQTNNSISTEINKANQKCCASFWSAQTVVLKKLTDWKCYDAKSDFLESDKKFRTWILRASSTDYSRGGDELTQSAIARHLNDFDRKLQECITLEPPRFKPNADVVDRNNWNLNADASSIEEARREIRRLTKDMLKAINEVVSLTDLWEGSGPYAETSQNKLRKSRGYI